MRYHTTSKDNKYILKRKNNSIFINSMIFYLKVQTIIYKMDKKLLLYHNGEEHKT